MSYTPQTWANGDIITAAKLNNIESGVQSVSNSYTPTTWVNGDIITATKLNNIEQGIANAGGGSSDFSMATMTVISSSDGTFGYLAFDPTSPLYYYYGDAYAHSDVPSETLGVLLYQGLGILDTYGAALTIGSVSGSIEYDSELAAYKITGDCTITIS